MHVQKYVSFPNWQVVICEVSDSNQLIALGKFEGEGRTFVSFDEIVLHGNSSNISKILTKPSICCSGPYPERDTEYGAEQLFDLEMLFIPNEPSLLRAHKFNFSTLSPRSRGSILPLARQLTGFTKVHSDARNFH